jgi:MFS family permease
MCFGLILLPYAPNQVLLTSALALYGVFSGAMNVSMNAQAVALEQCYGRSIMSSFHALFSFGGMTGAALGGLVASRHISPAAHFLIAALVYIVVALFAGRTLMSGGRGRPGQPVFARITGPLLGLGCLAFCILLNEGAMADWSSVYLKRSLGTGEGVAATGYAIFSFAMAFGRLLGDWLTERFGRVAIVRMGALVAACGMAVGLGVGSVSATLLGFGAAGAGFSIIVPLAFGAAGRNGTSAGAGLAAVNTAGYLGFLSGPAIIGFTADWTGLRAALSLVVVLSVVVSLLADSVVVPHGEHAAALQEPVLQ